MRFFFKMMYPVYDVWFAVKNTGLHVVLVSELSEMFISEHCKYLTPRRARSW